MSDETLSLVSCSLCLRVLHDSHWIDPRDAMRMLRRLELSTVVHLEPGICDRCTQRIVQLRPGSPQVRLQDAA